MVYSILSLMGNVLFSAMINSSLWYISDQWNAMMIFAKKEEKGSHPVQLDNQ